MAPEIRPATPPLLLASTSAYRARLLERLMLPFEQHDPAVIEDERPGEPPAARARRLARAKAAAVSRRLPQSWAIGSDQVASCVDQILHKPGSPAQQARQLARLSGRSARFDTAVALIGPGFRRSAVVATRVDFRRLSPAEIDAYVAREPAVDCCGGFRCEGLGITLFSRLRSPDPTALEGLPLLALARLLRQAGWLPADAPVAPAG